MATPLDDIRIVHASARYVVIDKPSGVLSVPGKGEENQACAVSWVREKFPRASGPIVVHRLDMDTSGLLILALDADAQRELSARFEGREVEKSYIAMVEGRVAEERGEIDLPMRLDPANRPHQVVDDVDGRPAQTAWRVLAYEPDRTRLELVPKTGRTHQLRVHCAYPSPRGLGHAIVGDVLYGRGMRDGERLMLHAARLALRTPDDGWMEFESRPEF